MNARPVRREPHLDWRWRGMLLAIAGGLLTVFVIAIVLRPYRDDGTARNMETHLQLGLPPCNFKVMTGQPCPSCGMTTSFALIVRGDVVNSMRANFVGTLLAGFSVLVLAWSVLSAVAGRLLWVRRLERTMIWVVAIFLVLLIGRWLVVLGLAAWAAGGELPSA